MRDTLHNRQTCALGNKRPTLGFVTDTLGLRERKKDATRRALAERALSMARERGYHGFTIADLVEDVGVSRRTFSNYFSSKAECLAAVTEGWLDDRTRRAGGHRLTGEAS